MPVAQLLVAIRPPEVAKAFLGQPPDSHGRFIVHVAGIYDPVPPDEHPPPQVRTGRSDVVDRLLVSVLPGIVFHEGHLIYQIAPEFLHLIQIGGSRHLHPGHSRDRPRFRIVFDLDFAKPPDIFQDAVERAADPELTVGRF